jgi:hypothetical protein
MAHPFRIFLIFLALAVTQAAPAVPNHPGCSTATQFLPIARLYSEIDGGSDSQTAYREMKRVKRLSCLGSFREGDTISYPSGGTATLYAGKDGATWNWSNGRTITLYAHRNGATWHWPNGQAITLYAYRLGATWYWPNGQIITNYAGQKGATYYNQAGRSVVSSGPELRNPRGELDMEPFLDLLDGLAAEIEIPDRH